MQSNDNKAQNKPFLYNNLVPLHKELHAKFGLTSSDDLSFAKSAHLVPIHMNELSSIVGCYPIIFVGEDKVPAAALGIEEGKNLFINEENNQWLEHFHIPAYIQRYPFLLANDSSIENTMLLCFDADSKRITNENPAYPFYKDGEYTDTTKHIFQTCLHFHNSAQLTDKLVKELADYDIFTAKIISYTDVSGEKKSIQFIGIDEKKFDALSDEDMNKLRKTGAINIAYAHLFSMANWNRLVNRIKSLSL